MPVIKVSNGDGSDTVTFSAPSIPAVMFGDCDNFRAWILPPDEPGNLAVMRATFTSGGQRHTVEVAGVEYLLSTGGDDGHREVSGRGSFADIT